MCTYDGYVDTIAQVVNITGQDDNKEDNNQNQENDVSVESDKATGGETESEKSTNIIAAVQLQVMSMTGRILMIIISVSSFILLQALRVLQKKYSDLQSFLIKI